MTNGAVAAGVAGSVAATAEALKAIGGIVVVEPRNFIEILGKTDRPLVIQSPSGFLTPYKYLTSYKGLTFFTKSKEALLLPGSVEMITAKKIMIPQM